MLCTMTDDELAAQLDKLRSRYFMVESEKPTADFRLLEDLYDEQEQLSNQVAAIYRVQRRRRRRAGSRGHRVPRWRARGKR